MLNFKEVTHDNVFELSQIKDGENTTFLAFLQNIQTQNSCVVLNVITDNSGKNLLLIQSSTCGYMIDLELASSQLYERFFANIHCICETERDLPVLLKHLPINKAKIDDFRILKSLAKSNESKPVNVRIQAPKYDDISFPYIRNVIFKSIEMLQTVDSLKKNIANQKKQEIYTSIINERYKTTQIYNGNHSSISEISDIYNVLSHEQKSVIDEIYAIIKNIASQNKVPNSSVISLQALETLALKSPVNFEDITHIFGFNKKYIHNAVCRKILSTFENKAVRVKRNSSLETALDLILYHASEKSGIDKNLICSKRDIIAYINGNINVDFLKGWKKEVFGNFVLAFTQGKSVISFKNQQIVIQ